MWWVLHQSGLSGSFTHSAYVPLLYEVQEGLISEDPVGNFSYERFMYFNNCGLYKLIQDALASDYELGLHVPRKKS